MAGVWSERIGAPLDTLLSSAWLVVSAHNRLSVTDFLQVGLWTYVPCSEHHPSQPVHSWAPCPEAPAEQRKDWQQLVLVLEDTPHPTSLTRHPKNSMSEGSQAWRRSVLQWQLLQNCPEGRWQLSGRIYLPACLPSLSRPGPGMDCPQQQELGHRLSQEHTSVLLAVPLGQARVPG